jgi:hypothetical protein
VLANPLTFTYDLVNHAVQDPIPAIVAAPTAFHSTVSHAFSVLNSVPSLSGLSQNSLAEGCPTFTLTVTGSDFVAGSTVQWNGSALAMTFVSSIQLTAIVPATFVAAPGTFPITVTTPAPGGGTLGAQTFAVVNEPSKAGFEGDAGTPSSRTDIDALFAGLGNTDGSNLFHGPIGDLEDVIRDLLRPSAPHAFAS